MAEELPDTNQVAAHRPEREGPPLESPDPIAPDPASPAESEFENDKAGRLKRLADTALATGKQAADATVSGSRKAAEVVGSAGVSTAQAIGNSAKTAVTTGASAAHAIGSGTAKAGVAGGQAVGKSARWVFDSTSAATAQVFSSAQALVASDLSAAINEVVAAAVEGAPTIYDKAMDAVYLETHMGGGFHRLFDGGHTISGAFKAASEASADDTLIQETLGAIQGLLRDVSTPAGLPLATWDKATYDAVAESLKSTFGIPKSWLSELVTYDAADVLGGTVGAVSVIFGWNRADTETFARLAAGIGMSAAVSVNPLLMPVSVVALARAFHKANSSNEYIELAEGGLKGAFATGSSLGAVALVGVAGGPAGVALLVGVTAGVLAHTATKDVTLDAISTFVKEDAATVARQVSQQAIAIGDAIGDLAADSGRAVAGGTASAGRFVAGSVSAVGRLTADQAAEASRAATSGAKASGRLATRGAAATSASIGSAAKRVKELIDRDESVELEDDESDPPTA
ncbi:hypothetical protein [Candidatus Poriferisodalis sp.]|uniref:hypothetical protein n=1 Tax=Candidatus Poriferisodalis sp. TaxID=3101277 RepID=UPI003B52F332